MKWKNKFLDGRLLLLLFCFFQCTFIQRSSAQKNQTRQPGILLLNHKNIDSILSIHEVHLVFFWGTWCKPCYASLDSIMHMHVERKEIKAVILAESQSSMKVLEKVLRKYDIRKSDNIVFGLLNPNDYKKNSNKNIRMFNRFICNQCG